MKQKTQKELIQWGLAIMIIICGMAIFVYGPSQKQAKAQMTGADPSVQGECQQSF